jgi:hypothetical protein
MSLCAPAFSGRCRSFDANRRFARRALVGEVDFDAFRGVYVAGEQRIFGLLHPALQASSQVGEHLPVDHLEALEAPETV